MLRGCSSSASSREYVASHTLDTPYMELGHPLPASLPHMRMSMVFQVLRGQSAAWQAAHLHKEGCT